MRVELGYCAVCDKEIAKKCQHCTHRQPTEDYTEVQMNWSNGSKMQVAVCKTCATTHAWTTPEAKIGITQAHFDAWDRTGASYDKAVVLV